MITPETAKKLLEALREIMIGDLPSSFPDAGWMSLHARGHQYRALRAAIKQAEEELND